MNREEGIRASFPDARPPLERMVDEMIRLRRMELTLAVLQCTVVMCALVVTLVVLREGWVG